MFPQKTSGLSLPLGMDKGSQVQILSARPNGTGSDQQTCWSERVSGLGESRASVQERLEDLDRSPETLQDSLTTMATFVEGYGLGLTDATAPYAVSFGHPGSDVGFIAVADCLPDSGSVIVVLSNTGVEDITMMRPLVLAAESE